jgi:hypothetical protein
MKDGLFTKAIKPKIYAFTTSQYKDTEWQGEKVGKGLLKIGYTERAVSERIWESFPTKTPEKQPFTIEAEYEAVDSEGNFFMDHLVHKKLEEKGFRRVNGEWFECTKCDVDQVILEIQTGRVLEDGRIYNFGMRPEQQVAVDKTKAYFEQYPKSQEGRAPHFLWNAKMRFGKTFTSYQLAKSMGWSKIIVLTYKPAVESAWEEDLKFHIDFDGWQFVNRTNTFDEVDESKPFVWFASFQDVLQPDKDGKVKARYEVAKAIDWDCVIVDEYHFGAWRDSAKDFYVGDLAKETDIDESIKAQEQFGEGSFPLKSEHFLYLSGTPFRAVASGEFTEDQIFNWTYADEQKAKNSWDNSQGENPYLELPQIVMMTYQLPDSVRAMIRSTGQNEFSLNEFFKAKESSDGIYTFEYENQVQQWLNIIRGQDQIYGSLAVGHQEKPPLPYEDANLLSYLNHTFWFLPSVASCYAMEQMLKKSNNKFYHDYNIIVSAGNKSGVGVGKSALKPVQEAIGSGLKTKSIVLSCGKLTTGVTVKQWSGIFMLRDTTSPETYFQSAFRVQSPWVLKNVDPIDIKKKEILKPKCYIFDFAPNRALNLIVGYSDNLDLNNSDRAEKRLSEFLNFMPVLCYDGTSMQELDAVELLDISITGVASTMLAKRWQSPQLIDVSTMTLERLLNAPEVLEALEKLEAFRNLNKDIRKVITSEKDIDTLKKEKADTGLTKAKDKELQEKQKESQGFKKKLREKLLKFITRIPVFMYLTDFREETLMDVIRNLEPELFRKVTGLTVDDFDRLCDVGVFNSSNINAAVFAFKRFEDYSLTYAGGRVLSEDDWIGGFDSQVQRSELDEVLEGV